MREKLPELGVECRVIPRLAIAGRAVSASDVRQCVKDGDWQHLQKARAQGDVRLAPKRCRRAAACSAASRRRSDRAAAAIPSRI